MSEDEPLEPVDPESVTEPVPTASVATAADAPAGPPPWSAPPAPSQGPPPSSGGSTVAVPKWLLLVVGAIVIAGLGFAAGWVAAPDDGGTTTRVFAPGQLGPRANGNGNGGGSGNQPLVPSSPRRGARSGFLGVATIRSTDPAGARVEQVIPDSPAASAGLQADDVITKVDSFSVSSPQQLANRISAHASGDKVTITYVRNGTTATKDVTLVRRTTVEPSTPSTTQPQF
ncbi:MAG: PDZ domain-containing protein [Acidimicrobiia bacterium]